MPKQSSIESALDRVLRDTYREARILDAMTDRFVVFSDHHKGQRDGADDFHRCEAAYLGALDYYWSERFTLIALGDAEELWENRVEPVLDAYANVLEFERRFHPDRYIKVWGNHDDEWESPRRVRKHLPRLFGQIEVQEGVRFTVRKHDADLGTLILLHGHQGTLFSDRLAGLAKLAVRFVWRTIQRLARFSSTTPATDACLRDEHDRAMYRWARQKPELVLIAGHTHRPVFSSKTHLQQLEEEIAKLERGTLDDVTRRRIEELRTTAEDVRRKNEACEDAVAGDEDRSRPCYFNSGCCCFGDGDITGIELAEGELRLVRWSTQDGPPSRKVLARTDVERIFTALRTGRSDLRDDG